MPEEDFLITGTPELPNSAGPERSRLNNLMLRPKLFDNCQFYLKGKFDSKKKRASNRHQIPYLTFS